MITVRIEFKAYGGTGSLLGRCFLALLALNACDKANTSTDKCVIYQLDYDDEAPETDAHNDASYFKDVCIANYIKLHNRGLGFLAPVELERSALTLKSVRDYAYPGEKIFSLNSLFCTGDHQAEIEELLSASFTTGSNSSEMKLSNAHGCYGDLAVNGFISERIIDTDAFAKMEAYKDLTANPNDAIVFYAGSTDGGTANTMIDKDIRSLLHHLQDSGVAVDHSRKFRLYGLRTTPYSKFELTGDQLDVAITSSILRDKFEMSKGVLENINSQNRRAVESKEGGIDNYSYYNLNDGTATANGTEYWLDGLFIAGSQTLDLTAWTAKKDNQFHPSHFTELTLAMQAMDAIAKRLPENKAACIYGYNDGGNIDGKREPVTLQTFFGSASVAYEYEIYDSQLKYGVSSFPLDKYIRAIMLTLVAIKGRMIDDFNNTSYPPQYVTDIFYKADPNQNIPAVCPLVAAELQNFINEAKFIVMALHDAMVYSKFGGNDGPIRLMEEEIKYIYSSDTLNNPITMPSSRSLSIDDQGSQIPGFCKVETVGDSAVPMFYVLDSMHTFNYHDGGMFAGAKKKLKGEELFLECGGAADPATVAKIANNMIKRTFETYLAMMQ